MEPSLHHSIFGKTGGKDIQPLSAFFLSASYFFQIYPLLIIACTPGIFNSEILFSFPFSDKIFCDIQQVMNRRNILRGVAQSNLSARPAALIYHAVLCCIFAVSLSIIHETQIPFTFFQDFLKKVFGGEEEPHRHCFAMPPPLIRAALAKRSGFTKCQGPPY